MGCNITKTTTQESTLKGKNQKNDHQINQQTQKIQQSNGTNQQTIQKQRNVINIENNIKHNIQQQNTNNINSNKQKSKQTQSNEINQKIIGVPHIQNEYWQMLRNGKTKSLTKAFQDQLVTCDQVIVPASGHTIVHESVILDKREYFKLCEVYGANWDKKDLNGVTPLMKAVALNRAFYVQKLLELGANMDLKDNRGRTALQYGLIYQSYDAVDLLKQASNQ